MIVLDIYRRILIAEQCAEKATLPGEESFYHDAADMLRARKRDMPELRELAEREQESCELRYS